MLCTAEHIMGAAMSATVSEYRKEDVVLVEDYVQTTQATSAQLPENLGDYLHAAGVLAGIGATIVPTVVGNVLLNPLSWIFAPLALIGGAVSWGVLNSTDDVKKLRELKAAYAGLRFVADTKRPVRSTLGFTVALLRREDGGTDLGIQAKATLSTSFRLNDQEPVLASMFRDAVTFSIRPADGTASGFVRDIRSLLPPTQVRTTKYAYNTTWQVGGGFTGQVEAAESPKANLGFSANGSYAFSASAERDADDFETTRTTAGADEVVSWTSRLQTVLDGGAPSRYSVEQPDSLVAHTIFTKWLRMPPPSATEDLDLGYLAAFLHDRPLDPSRPLRFHFSCQQRLMHAEVFGRWGAMSARVGGAAGVIPAMLIHEGTLVIDPASRSARIEDEQLRFLTMPEAVDEILSHTAVVSA